MTGDEGRGRRQREREREGRRVGGQGGQDLGRRGKGQEMKREGEGRGRGREKAEREGGREGRRVGGQGGREGFREETEGGMEEYSVISDAIFRRNRRDSLHRASLTGSQGQNILP